MLANHPMKLLCLVTEGIIEEKLIRDLKRLGVKEYTAWDVHGEGKRGKRRQEWEVHDVRLEFLLDETLTEKVLELLQTRYLPHYEMKLWVQDVFGLSK